MTYFRGLSASPDPWAQTAEPGLLGQLTSALSSGIDKLASAIGTPVAHPAPLTEAEKQRLLGTTSAVATTAPVAGPRSKLPLVLGLAAIGGVGLYLYKKRRGNPARRRRRRSRRGRR